jgi:hypothetical protein
VSEPPDLRAALLALNAADAGIAPSPALPRVWGALMELGTGDGAASLVMLADGTTSLYTSTGGGIIGGGEHEPVASATRAFLTELERHLDFFETDADDRLPAPDEVIFRALTYSGRRSLAAAEDDLGEGRHPRSRLFYAGHDVLTQLRLVEEAAARGR